MFNKISLIGFSATAILCVATGSFGFAALMVIAAAFAGLSVSLDEEDAENAARERAEDEYRRRMWELGQK